MIDAVALRSLAAVDRLGSVAAAADSLGYTASAVSQQVKRLEARAGVALLEKYGRGVMLTEAGRLLAASAHDLLAQMEQLESQLQSTTGRPAGRVRLASFATAARGVVAPALAALRESSPELEVTLSEAEPWDAVSLVATGQVDLAVVHNWEPLPLAIPDHLTCRHLGSDYADVLVHCEHPLAGRERVSAAELAGERWVSVAPGSICHQWLTKMFHDIGRAPRIEHFAAEFASHIALVAQGLAVALVPRLGRGELPAGVVAVHVVAPVPTRTVTAVWRRTMGESPALAAVVEALADAPSSLVRPQGDRS
ncbi:LysR family transcriptional regulator [Oryzihumus leptocrescens]|uniref:DNA-binding transcriptional LysR family regulator n=1 Tax=Oryzihumus leptocrescens TaxID=297536 RepID=A0A542ZKV3_9MICO|nr:LysR family transcriptional regulator [Oryzihumus leptocrescens]TQL60790.1 DNA-binding transcriptional LysR family regulator [Oryzihumus leptocrescens]